MVAILPTGRICDGPISKNVCLVILYHCAEFQICIAKCTIRAPTTPAMTLLNMASTGNRTLDLLILSPTPYSLDFKPYITTNNSSGEVLTHIYLAIYSCSREQYIELQIYWSNVKYHANTFVNIILQPSKLFNTASPHNVSLHYIYFSFFNNIYLTKMPTCTYRH